MLGRPLGAALERVARLSGRRVGLALVYHRVGDSRGDPRRELLPALGASLFEGQLRHVTSRYRVVSASQLPAAIRARRRGERFPVAITLDDDLSSHAEVVAPLLELRGATATFFLTGSSLWGGHSFWWERLQFAVDQRLDIQGLGLPSIEEATIHELGHAVEDLSPRDRDEVDAALGRIVGSDPPDAGLRRGDVERLVASGFEIGFHTRRHDRLTEVDRAALEHAMHHGREELESVTARVLTAIAYPHGRADERVARAARAAGFDTGFTGQPEAVTPAADPLLLGRLSPSYDSVGELALDIALAIVRASASR